MASTKKNGFHYKEWLPLKEMASAKNMASAKKNSFYKTEWLPLKGMLFHYGQWFRERRIPSKGIVSTTATYFH